MPDDRKELLERARQFLSKELKTSVRDDAMPTMTQLLADFAASEYQREDGLKRASEKKSPVDCRKFLDSLIVELCRNYGISYLEVGMRKSAEDPPAGEGSVREIIERAYDAGDKAGYQRGCEDGAHPHPKIVCLCGSTRFYEYFQRANYEETMAGHIVLSVGFYPHAQKQMHSEDVGCTPEQKLALDELHKRKIDLADEILVLNVDGYIGSSTRGEIEHAEKTGKPIRYLEALRLPGEEAE